MQFVVLTRRRTEVFRDADYTPERLTAETAAVRQLYAEGVVRQIWHRGDIGGACLLLEVASEADARERLGKLPLFAAGMQEAVCVVPLNPYRGFVGG